MRFINTRLATFALITLLFGFSISDAATPVDIANAEFSADVQSDYNTVSNLINGQLARSYGFYSALGWQVNPTVLDVIKGPRIEFGVGAGVDLMKMVDVNSIQLLALQSGGNIDIPRLMPFPFPVWHVKAGLLKGLDFGIKGGSIPRLKLNDGQFSFVNKNLGMELRATVMQGISLPTITVCASWDHLQGDFYANTDVNQTGSYQADDMTTYTGTILGTAQYYTSWNVRSFGVKMVVGKALGAVYPFAGIGFQRNAGSVHSSLSVRVHESLTNGVVTAEQDLPLDYSNDRRPKVVEAKVLGGFELGGPFYWSNLFETNGKDMAISTGFRIQI